MIAVPYRIIMEELEITLPEQNLLDHVSRRYETIDDWEWADQILTTEQFISLLSPVYISDRELNPGRFLQLMDMIAFEQCYNENNQKYYWLLRIR